MPNFIDIHTHSLDPNPKSVLVLDPRNKMIAPTTPFCFGLHPWFIESMDISQYKKQRESAFKDPKFFALGEIGLDTKISFPIEKQIEVLKSEIEFAKEKDLNIVVHIVGAFNEFIRILKKSRFEGNILIHGFSANPQIQTQLLQFKTFYSFGHLIFHSKKVKESLINTPLHRLFFETDDQSTHSIEEVYTESAKILKIDLNQLADQIEANYRAFRKI